MERTDFWIELAPGIQILARKIKRVAQLQPGVFSFQFTNDAYVVLSGLAAQQVLQSLSQTVIDTTCQVVSSDEDGNVPSNNEQPNEAISPTYTVKLDSLPAASGGDDPNQQ